MSVWSLNFKTKVDKEINLTRAHFTGNNFIIKFLLYLH